MKKEKEFQNLLVIVTGFIALFLIFKSLYFIYIAFSVSILSLIFPPIAKGILWIWFKISEGLGWFNSRVLLGITFYLFLTPIAFLSRLIRKDEMHIKEGADVSLYKMRDHQFVKEDLMNPW